MPTAAIMGVGMGASALGGILGSKTKLIDVPPPKALYPQVQSQYLSNLTQPGGLGNTAMGSLRDIAKTGAPSSFATNAGNISDYGSMFEALLASRQRSEKQGMADIMESFGASGLRYSSDLANKLVDFRSQLGADYGNILAQYAFQAIEAAKSRQLTAEEGAAGRQLQASAMGTELFQEPALTTYQSKLAQQGGGIGAGLSSVGSGLESLALMKGAGLLK